MIAHSLENFNFQTNDSTEYLRMKDADVVIVETWHQYCTSCFVCMEDQHQALQRLEDDHDFRHYYAFIGKNMSEESIYEFETLPFHDQKIIIDKDQNYYNTLEMIGAPYLNFYKKGEYRFSIGGYESRYADQFREYVKREVIRLVNEK